MTVYEDIIIYKWHRYDRIITVFNNPLCIAHFNRPFLVITLSYQSRINLDPTFTDIYLTTYQKIANHSFYDTTYV